MTYEYSLSPRITWVPENPARIEAVTGIVKSRGLSVAEVFTGGRIWRAEGKSLTSDDIRHLSTNRPFAVVLARLGDNPVRIPDKVLRIPTVKEGDFAETQVSWTRDYARFVMEQLRMKGTDEPPIPVAIDTFVNPEDAGLVTVTKYIELIKGLGKGGPDNGEHEFDTNRLALDQIPEIVRLLDEISLPSKEYAAWMEANKVQIPQRSWHKKGYEKCALRGQQWWFNDGRAVLKDDGIRSLEIGDDGKIKQVWKDRLEELQGKVVESEKMTGLFQQYAPNIDIAQALRVMIKNNQRLYLLQNGQPEIGSEKYLGEQVVTHGTLNPENIHLKMGKNGKIQIVITGGDRSQLYGLRGQQIDWLVSSCAAHPEYQDAFIKAFIDLQNHKGRDVNKEKRGLAMHVLYRSIMEARWFADKGRMDQAQNLVKLSTDILQGNGVWNGVNTPLESQAG